MLLPSVGRGNLTCFSSCFPSAVFLSSSPSRTFQQRVCDHSCCSSNLVNRFCRFSHPERHPATTAFKVPTIVEMMVLMTFACVVMPVHKHSQVFPTEEVLSEILSAASLSFCPGLLEAIDGTDPPGLSFKSLPTDVHKRWSIYALVLEKHNAMPLVYVGSGTQATAGVRSRLKIYDSSDNSTLPMITCRKQSELDRHQLSKRYKQKAELKSRGLSYKPSRSMLKQARAKEHGKHFCETCEILRSSQYKPDRHNRSKRHLKQVAEDKSSSRST